MTSLPCLPNSPCRPDHQAFRGLSGYLTGAVGTITVLASSEAQAAVTAVDFGFGSTLSTATSTYGSSDFWSVTGAGAQNFGNMYARGNTNSIMLGRDGGSFAGAVYHQSIVGTHDYKYNGLPTLFSAGTLIDGSAGFGLSGNNGSIGRSFWFNSYNSDFDITSNINNQNIAFRTSGGNLGWANVSWDAAANVLTFNSAYVESVPGQAITVGDIGAAPEPSRALLALAGLAAVGLRRRRKQVA